MVMKVIPSMDSISLSSNVLCKNCRSLLSFFQSEMSGERTIVHRNDMEVCRSGYDRFPTNNFFVRRYGRSHVSLYLNYQGHLYRINNVGQVWLLMW